jgi:predicted ester cyclase
MAVEENKRIVREFIEKVWNKGQYELVSRFIGDDYVAWALGSKKTVVGVEGVLANVQGVQRTFEGFRVGIEDMFGEDDKVVSRLTLHSMRSAAPVTMREIIIHRIAGGKIVEAWSLGSQWD